MGREDREGYSYSGGVQLQISAGATFRLLETPGVHIQNAQGESALRFLPGETVRVKVHYKVQKEGWTGGSWSVNAILKHGSQELDRDGHAHSETTTIGEGDLTPQFIFPDVASFYDLTLYLEVV